MEIGSYTNICIAVVAIIGVSISVREFMRSNKLKRSSCIEPLVDKLKSKENNLSIQRGITERKKHKYVNQITNLNFLLLWQRKQ